MSQETELLAILTFSFSLMSFILIGVMLYWVSYYKGGIGMRIQARLMGSKSADVRRMKKIQKAIKKDMTDFIVNENPELIKQFPETMGLASENSDWIPDIAGGLTQVLGTFVLRAVSQTSEPTSLLGSSLRAADMEQKVVANMVNPIIKGIFGWFRGGNKKDKEAKPGSSKGVI